MQNGLPTGNTAGRRNLVYKFTFAAFITGGFVDALPGILIQLILIPVIMKLLDKI